MILKGVVKLKENELYFNDTRCIIINPRKEILNHILIKDYQYNGNYLEVTEYSSDFKSLQDPYFFSDSFIGSNKDFIPCADMTFENEPDSTITVENGKINLIGKVVTKSNILKSKGNFIFVLKVLVLTRMKSHDLTITFTNVDDYYFIVLNQFYCFQNLSPSKIKFVSKHKTLIFDDKSALGSTKNIINEDITRLLNYTLNDTIVMNSSIADSINHSDSDELVSYECEITRIICDGVFELDHQYKLFINQKMYLGVGAIVELLNVHFYQEYFVCCLQSTVNIKKFGKMELYNPLKCSFYDYLLTTQLKQQMASLLSLGFGDSGFRSNTHHELLQKIEGYVEMIHKRGKFTPNYDSLVNHEQCNFIRKVELANTMNRSGGYMVCFLDNDLHGNTLVKDQYGSLKSIRRMEKGLVCITDMEFIDEFIDIKSVIYLYKSTKVVLEHPSLDGDQYRFIPLLIPQTVLKYVFTKTREIEKQPVITIEGLLNNQKCFIQMKSNVFECYIEYILHIPKKYIKQFGNEYAISWDDSITYEKTGKSYSKTVYKNYLHLKNHQLANICGKIIDKKLYLNDLVVNIKSDLLLNGYYMYLKNVYIYYDQSGVYGEILSCTEVNLKKELEAEVKKVGYTFMSNLLANGDNGWIICDVVKVLEVKDTLTVAAHDGTMDFIVVFSNSQLKSMTSETDIDRVASTIPTRMELMIYGFATGVSFDTFSPNSTVVEKVEMLKTRTFKTHDNAIMSMLTLKNVKVYCRQYRIIDPVLSCNLILSKSGKIY
ncbi:hypothetical protein HK103_005541 [Boothiomyces macroporosus]|uniref:Uncharacterized protein n=1 Tax=Boothiomyces macroporosus TaxID=261099 RepID=A0AAD5Y3A8_9FUNG|nr:hypothetical protein HK103_005541 [Boothiomyces macroporosus]